MGPKFASAAKDRSLVSVHPIERLRYVARAGDEGPSLLVREAAGALASFSRDPAALVTACRRLVDRQPNAAPIWWLAAKVLGAAEPASEAWAAAQEIEDDPTPDHLVELLPADAMVLVFGWPELSAQAVARRGDLEVLVVDVFDQGSGFVRRLDRMGSNAVLVDERGVGAAAAAVDLVIIEAHGLGGTSITALPGARAAAAVARSVGTDVWAVAGIGRVLPGRMWTTYEMRLDDAADPWDSELELVPLDLITAVIGPTGSSTPAEALRRADCPIAPELLKPLD